MTCRLRKKRRRLSLTVSSRYRWLELGEILRFWFLPRKVESCAKCLAYRWKAFWPVVPSIGWGAVEICVGPNRGADRMELACMTASPLATTGSPLRSGIVAGLRVRRILGLVVRGLGRLAESCLVVLFAAELGLVILRDIRLSPLRSGLRCLCRCRVLRSVLLFEEIEDAHWGAFLP